LQALNILENFDLRSLGYNSPEYIHIVTEALKLVFADREAFYGDPNFSSIPIDGLLSKEYAAQRAKRINPETACPGLPPFGDPWSYSKLEGYVSKQPVFVDDIEADLQYEAGTTHISVVDQFGNFACATPSGGAFNKSVFFPQLGFALSTRSEMFNLVPGHPNCLEPGKRPRTTIINFMVSDNGAPIMTVGCPGGDAQAQANLQLLLNTILWGMNVQEAVEAPRFSTLSVPNSFYPHTYLRGQLALEHEIAETTASELARMGHKIVRVATCGMGGTVTRKKAGSSVLETSADPRRSCYALSW
jgi:gamma-glutamyltranspeptidase/glutathione hydrolase